MKANGLNEAKNEGIDNAGFTRVDNHNATAVDMTWRDTITYSWSNVNAFVKPDKGLIKGKHALREEKQILFDVTGISKPGELIAIMGASGAGKTTLLNVLTARSGENLRIQGDLYLNGEVMTPNDLTTKSGYVQQDDLFIGTMTVHEQLNFQATLRIDRHVSKEDRVKRVNRVINEFGLTKCLNTLIGVEGRIKGISGGETKRLAFACEVLTNPPLMFCDEPTSGLDSFMAQTIVSAMRFLTKRGKTIITTIHQPSSQVFAMFDRVLLMAEGRLAYMGYTADALKFFAGMGRTSPRNFNPSDFFITTLAIQPGYEDECKRFVTSVCDNFQNSDEMEVIKDDVRKNRNDKDETEVSTSPFNLLSSKKSPYKAGWLQQSWALNKRALMEMSREPMLLRIKVIQTIMVGAIIAIIYWDTGSPGVYDQSSVQNINGCLFILMTNLSFQFAFGVVNTFCSQLPIFLREHFNGMYRTDVFYISKNLAEFPGTIFLPLLFLVVTYWLVNFNRDIATFFEITLALILLSNVSLSYGYLISCLAKDLRMALAIAAPMLIPFMIFGGFFLNPDTVPGYFIWLQYISWFNYGNEALIISQWRSVEHIGGCNETEIFCYSNGKEVIAALGYQEDNLWYDYVLLIALMVFFRFLAYLALLRRTYVRS